MIRLYRLHTVQTPLNNINKGRGEHYALTTVLLTAQQKLVTQDLIRFQIMGSFKNRIFHF